MSFTNLIEKFLVEKKIHNPIAVPLFGGIISFFIGIAIFIFHGFVIVPLMQMSILLASGIFLILYLFPYFQALSIDDSSRVVPLFQFVPVCILLLSNLFLKEQLSGHQLAAFFCIILGGFLLGMEKSDITFLKPRKSLLLMLLSSFIAAFVGVLFKYAYVANDFFTTLAYQSVGSGIAVLFFLLVPTIRRGFVVEFRSIHKDVISILLFNKGLEFIAELISLVAITVAPVALVSVFGGLQSFFVLVGAIVLSLWFPHILKEHISRMIVIQKTISISLIFMGIYFLSN